MGQGTTVSLVLGQALQDLLYKLDYPKRTRKFLGSSRGLYIIVASQTWSKVRPIKLLREEAVISPELGNK